MTDTDLRRAHQQLLLVNGFSPPKNYLSFDIAQVADRAAWARHLRQRLREAEKNAAAYRRLIAK